MNQIFSINRGYKTFGLTSSKRHYVIGFKNALTARKIMHSLQPEAIPTLLRNEPELLSYAEEGLALTIDSSATLFIPKFKGAGDDPMNDGGYHINTVEYSDFLMYPVTKNLGVIVPYVLIDESDDEFTYRSHVIDPMLFYPIK